jgi:ATP-dependent Clp protease ATP-binding subunit ClpA
LFERFTEDARRAVRLAEEEARRLRHPSIGAEHILIALLDEGHGPAARALRDHGLVATDLRQRVLDLVDPGVLDPEALAAIGIDLDQVREITESTFGEGALEAPMREGHIPFAKPAKKVLELSVREAVRLKHRRISTGHLLLGLLREGKGLAPRILTDAGANLTALRDDVTRLIPDQAA